MTKNAKIAAMTGFNLAIGSAAIASNPGILAESSQPKIDPNNAPFAKVLQSDSREFEASFLNVSATCKGSHAAFDAVAVAIQEIPAEVRSIHADLERA